MLVCAKSLDKSRKVSIMKAYQMKGLTDMMNMQYYKMEQDLFGEIEKEKKLSLHKLLMLLALSSVARKAA